MTSRFLALAFAACGIAGVSIAQFPSQRPSDTGPLVPSGVANISVAPGYRLTLLFDVTASIVIQGLFLALFIGMISGVVPSWGAARKSVAATLREVF